MLTTTRRLTAASNYVFCIFSPSTSGSCRSFWNNGSSFNTVFIHKSLFTSLSFYKCWYCFCSTLVCFNVNYFISFNSFGFWSRFVFFRDYLSLFWLIASLILSWILPAKNLWFCSYSKWLLFQIGHKMWLLNALRLR